MLNSELATEENIKKTGLAHRTYLPPEGKGHPAVVFVHGRAGDGKVMWIFSRALQDIKPVIVSPEATVADSKGGFSWWDVDKYPPGAPLSIEEKIQVLTPAMKQMKNFVDKLPEVYNVDPNRIYAAGFSQGGGLLSALSLKHPELFKGVAILSSFIPKTIQDDPELINPNIGNELAKLPKYFIFHGIEDEVIPHSRAKQTEEFLKVLNTDVEFHEDAVGHKVSSSGIKALKAWFKKII